jgi:hypothetical protein
MLAICTWLWGDKYSVDYVHRLHAGLRKHLKRPFRFLLMTERERTISLAKGIERHAIKDPELTEIKGCFARLRMFDRGWQQNRKLDGPVVCLDLDVVITGPLDILFDRNEPIVLLKGANSVNPCPFNNSVFMFRAGAHPELWLDFSMEAVSKIRQHEFPDDQGWFWHKLDKPAVWHVGYSSGIYAFRKPGWPPDDRLPKGARMVAFPGHRDPSKFRHLTWIDQHWIGGHA